MSPRLPGLSSKKVVSALVAAGFVVVRTKGSHYQLVHLDDPKRRLTVPYHGKDLKKGTLRAIIRQAGLTTEEFLELL